MGIDDTLVAVDDHAARFGVEFSLNADTQTMQFRGGPDWLKDHLKDCRPRYTVALRFRAGLCISCGMDAAKHPISHGRRQVFDPETKLAAQVLKPDGTFAAVWETSGPTAKVADRILPALWCKSCWSRGAFEEFAFGIPRKAGPRVADSKTRAAEDALFAAFDDEPEEQTVLF